MTRCRRRRQPAVDQHQGGRDVRIARPVLEAAVQPGRRRLHRALPKAGESAWKDGLPMWYDSRNSECRGSLVHLTPGTDYEVQFGLPGQPPVGAGSTPGPGAENFPIAQDRDVLERLAARSTSPRAAAPSGYVLYTGAGHGATLDGGNGGDYNITVSAPYVIVRGLTLKGAQAATPSASAPGAQRRGHRGQRHQRLGQLQRQDSTDGWKVGVDMRLRRSAPRAAATPCLRAHRHPAQQDPPPALRRQQLVRRPSVGPARRSLSASCGGNHVIRYNEIYSADGHYFNDGIGGEDNFSQRRLPERGHRHLRQHASSTPGTTRIEAEGANRNVRIWGNYIDQHRHRHGHHGDRGRAGLHLPQRLQPQPHAVACVPLDAGRPQHLRQVGLGSRLRRRPALRVPQHAAAGDRSRARRTAGRGRRHQRRGLDPAADQHRVAQQHLPRLEGALAVDRPEDRRQRATTSTTTCTTAASGRHRRRRRTASSARRSTRRATAGRSEAGGNYQLAPSSPGYDKGVRLPNFNDDFTGAAPDMGAHEAGTRGDEVRQAVRQAP